MVGTRLFGLRPRYWGVLVTPNSLPASIRSYRQAEFAATPEDFLDVDGIRAPPNLEHLGWSSLIYLWCDNCKRITGVSAEATSGVCPRARPAGESPEPRQ